MISCPICLTSTANPTTFLFQCTSSRCTSEPAPNPLRSAWLDLEVKTPTVSRTDLPSSSRIVPSGMPCRVCHEMTTLAVCSRCGNVLPESWRSNTPTASAAVLGARGSGKSTFIAVALKMLSDVLLRPSGWVMQPAFDLTEDVYRRNYWEPLVNGSALTPTRPDAQNRMIRYPLTYEVSQGIGDNHRSSYLSVFDVAGEDLHTREGIRAAGQFIPFVDSIIFLVDPLQFASVRLAARGVMSLPGEAASPDVVLSNIISQLRVTLALTTSEPIRTPITIAVAKFDSIMRLSGNPSCLLHNLIRPGATMTRDPRAGPRPPGRPPVPDADFVDAEARSLLECLDAWQFLSTVEQNFATSRFTVFSALGYSPLDGSALKPTWMLPHRVADPLAGVLARTGIGSDASR